MDISTQSDRRKKMKTVTVTFPIQEAVEALRLLRGESRCLIEQTEFMPDFDIEKRINHVLSARERIVTALEEIANTEDDISEPSQIAMNVPSTGRSINPMDGILSDAVAAASGEAVEAPVAMKHGVVMPNNFDQVQSDWKDADLSTGLTQQDMCK